MIIFLFVSFGLIFWLELYKLSLKKLTHSHLHKLKKENFSKINIFEKWLQRKSLYKRSVATLIFIVDAYFLIYTFNHFYFLTFFGLLLVYLTVKELPQLTNLAERYFMLILIFNNALFYPFTLFLIPYNYVILKTKSKFKNLYQEEESIVASKEDQILSLVEQDNLNISNISLEEEEKRMIKGIFTLDDVVVREVMTPRIDIKGVSLESSFEEAIEALNKNRFSRLPVYNQTIDEIVGIIHVKDFLSAKEKKKTVKNLMYSAIYVPETKKLDELLNTFKKEKNHFAVVVDEYGGTSGIITIEDILEEIVGEIQDEFDEEEEKHLFFDENNSIILDARTSIIDINKYLELKIPESDSYETLGGYIFSIVGEIPRKGDKLRENALLFEILDADSRKINVINIQKL